MNFNQIRALMEIDELSVNAPPPGSRAVQVAEMVNAHLDAYRSYNLPLEYLYCEKGRQRRNFNNEVKRLLQEVVASNLSFHKKRMPKMQTALKEISAEDILNNEEQTIHKIVFPELSKTEVAGDAFFYFLNAFTQGEISIKQYAEDMAKQDRGPYETVLSWFAALGLISQAQSKRAAGRTDEAWINLIDASFVIGCQHGSEVTMKIEDLSRTARTAALNALIKNAPLTELKEYAMDLYIKSRNGGEKKSVRKFTDEVFPILEIRLKELSQSQINKQRKAISVSKPTIYKFLCKVENTFRNHSIT